MENDFGNRKLISLSKKHPNKLIIADLYTSSLKNKFKLLSERVKGIVDVLLVSETKLDDASRKDRFTVPRLDLSKIWWQYHSILLYVCEDILSKLISSEKFSTYILSAEIKL